jgi:hypothetical protein
MNDFDTIPVPDTERTDDTEPAGSVPPFGPEPRERTRELRAMETQLAELYAQIGIYGGMLGGQAGNIGGGIVARNSTQLASAWIDLAEKDASVRAAIRRVLQSGGWAGVIGAHVATILPIAAIAGVLPRDFAQRVFMGLAITDPKLYAWIAEQTGNAPTASNGDGS